MTGSKKQKKSIEAQLECKATGELNSQIVDELMAEDKSLSELLDESPPEEEDKESSEV